MIVILVVDDETDVESLFKQKFRQEIRDLKMKFMFAHTGEDAMEVIKELQPMKIQLMLTDINMPGMSGIQLVGKVKADYPSIRSIVVSAYNDKGNADLAMEGGATAMVTKPVDFVKLKELIHTLVKDTGEYDT